MTKGYVIFTEQIHDRDGMNAYGAKSFPTMMNAGGRLLVADDGAEVLEGEWPGSRTVIVEFDSVKAARAWYRSPAYRATIPLRQAAADASVVIVTGFAIPAG